MAQVISNTPYNKLNTAIGGWRVKINEAINGVYQGWKYMGVVFEPKFDPKVEFAKAYDTGSGQEVEIRSVPIVKGLSCTFKASELMADNFRRYLMSTLGSRTAANPTATHAAETGVAGVTGDVLGLAEGKQSQAQRDVLKVYLVAEDEEDARLLRAEDVEADPEAEPPVEFAAQEYEIITQHGETTIKLLTDEHASETLRIGEGATATDPYHFVKPAKITLNPLTRAEQNCKVILEGPSKSGPNMRVTHDACLIAGTGFDWNKKDFSSLEFKVEFQDDSVSHPSEPFGRVEVLGYNEDGTAVV